MRIYLFSHHIRYNFLLFLILFLAITCSCSPQNDKKAYVENENQNIIVISIDTLRADHLGCYGYERNISPRIDAFAKQATLYNNAISTASWTLPAHASLFTGKYVFKHGVHPMDSKDMKRLGGGSLRQTGPLGNKIPENVVNNVPILSLEHNTLAESLNKAGYQTGAIAANEVYLKSLWQLNQGFDTYKVKLNYSPLFNRSVFEWIDGHLDKPFFLFINYMDTHRPFNTAPRSFFESCYRSFYKLFGKNTTMDNNPFLYDKLAVSVVNKQKPPSKPLFYARYCNSMTDRLRMWMRQSVLSLTVWFH